MNIKNLILSFLIIVTLFSTNFAYSNAVINYNEGKPDASLNICDPKYFGGDKDPSGACAGRGTVNNASFQDQVIAIIRAVNNFLWFLAPTIAVLAIIVGAFNIIQNGFKTGVLIIQWALIGMTVVLLSSGILSIILKILVG